jgi:hypothetical protein
MNDLAGLKVLELRNILKDEFGLSTTQANNIKGKKALIQAIEEARSDDAINDGVLDNLELCDTSTMSDNTNIDTETEQICPSDPQWTDHVLNELTNDEKIQDKNNPKKEYPTTDGLRRLVERFIGQIVKLTTNVHQTPSPDNERRATVSVTISILSQMLEYPQLMEFSGAADVYVSNSPHPFFYHPVATAETKAEGRAYKRALKIKVSTYEEMGGAHDLPYENTIEAASPETNDLIKPEQVNFIDLICKRLDINVKRLVTHFYDYDQLKQLPYEDACALLTLLQDYQNDPKTIPKNMQKYNPNWQNEF